MGTMSPQEEAFWQFVHQFDRAIERQRSIVQSTLAERESPSESENEDIEPSPVDSYDAAVPCIPLTVGRQNINPKSVATHSVRAGGAANAYRAEGYDKMKIEGNWHHDDPAQANSGKTV